MIYSEIDILRSMSEPNGIRIDPFDESRLQRASYDLTLGNKFMSFTPWQLDEPLIYDVAEKAVMYTCIDDHKIIKPGEFLLGVTRERVYVPLHCAGRLDGKSSLARLGIFIHCTGGNIDPGNNLNITLEIYNASPVAWLLHAGMPIAQMIWQELKTPASRPYDGKYLNSRTVESSRMHLNFEKE